MNNPLRRFPLVKKVEALLDQGADKNSREFGDHGDPVLIRICRHGHFTLGKLLIERNADINLPSTFPNGGIFTTALMATAGHCWELRYSEGQDFSADFFNLACLLIEKDADVHARNLGGSTALIETSFFLEPFRHSQASTILRLGLIRLLLERKADVNAANEIGYTPLIVACMCGSYEGAELLIENGADVNKRALDKKAFAAFRTSNGGLPFDPIYETALSAAHAHEDTDPAKAKLIHLLEQRGAIE